MGLEVLGFADWDRIADVEAPVEDVSDWLLVTPHLDQRLYISLRLVPRRSLRDIRLSSYPCLI